MKINKHLKINVFIDVENKKDGPIRSENKVNEDPWIMFKKELRNEMEEWLKEKYER